LEAVFVHAEWLYYLWVLLLVIANALAWATNLFSLPGNWIIVALTAWFAFALPVHDGRGISWWIVAVVVVLAIVGEIIEFFAGAAGAASQGASRRSVVLALVGTLVGSIAGAIVGLPITLVGSVLAALGGGAAGAFIGAYAGEISKGRTAQHSAAVGQGALIGRLIGTLGKLIVGGVMFAVVAVDAFL
jgi:uncharacterized protein YqgC (DUF456 family)